MITQDSLSSAIATKVAAKLEDRKESIIAEAGGFARRLIVKEAWPTIKAEVPVLVHLALELIHEEFGRMTLDDLMNYVGRQVAGGLGDQIAALHVRAVGGVRRMSGSTVAGAEL